MTKKKDHILKQDQKVRDYLKKIFDAEKEFHGYARNFREPNKGEAVIYKGSVYIFSNLNVI